MYKLLLCWRYLLTRYLALVCIISVMLGVATLIVVNSVMAGFSTKLRDRLHGLLSDVVIESMGMDGFPAPAEKMERIRSVPFLNERIEAMTPAEARAQMEATAQSRKAEPLPVDRVEERMIPGPAGQIRLRLYWRKRAVPVPAIGQIGSGLSGFSVAATPVVKLVLHDVLCQSG